MPWLALKHGLLSLQLDLGDAYLRGLHTGRSFSDTVRDFVAPSIDALVEAEELRQVLSQSLAAFNPSITDGTVFVVSNEHAELGRWDLLSFVGHRDGGAAQWAAEVLRLMGFDPATKALSPVDVPLGSCPVCGKDARIAKVVRPLVHLGVDPRMLVGVPIGEHMVFYNSVCPEHSVPVRPRPNIGLAALESAYQSGLEESDFRLLHHERLSTEHEGHLLIGYDAGSLLLEARRVKALLVALDIMDRAQCVSEALFPDALWVGEARLTEAERRRVSLRAAEIIQTLFPSRLSPLGLARPLDLQTTPVGRIEFGS